MKAYYRRPLYGAADRRRTRHRARRPPGALARCSRSSPNRAAARRRVRGPARRCSRRCRSSKGWGVELGLLIDIVERFGLDAIAQVDLGVREHRNRPLAELAPQALAILVDRACARAGARRTSALRRAAARSTPTARSTRSRSRCASARRSSRSPRYRAQASDSSRSAAVTTPSARARPGFDRGFLDEQRGAGERLAGCHTRSVSASTCDVGEHARAPRARRRST